MSSASLDEAFVNVIFGFFMAACHTTTGVAAAYAGLGRLHWFWRVGAVALLLIPWMAIGAGEMVLTIGVQFLVAAAALRLWRRVLWQPTGSNEKGSTTLRPERARFTFTMRDLLLATLVIAGACAVLVTLEQSTNCPVWLTVTCAVVYGLGTVSAAGVCIARRSWLKFGWFVVMVAVQVAAAAALDYWWRSWSLFYWPLWTHVPFTVLAGTLTCGWVAVMRPLLALPPPVNLSGGDPSRGSRRAFAACKTWLARLTLGLTSLLTLAIGVLTYLDTATPPPIPQTMLPHPNAYQDLARAGAAIAALSASPDESTGPIGQQRAAILAEARKAVALKCARPLTYTEADFDNDTIFGFRQLGLAFLAEGQRAEAEGQITDASTWYADSVRLGRSMACGGLKLDALVGSMLTGAGVEGIAKIRLQLAPEQLRHLIEFLSREISRQEDYASVVQRDNVWEQNVYGWSGRLHQVIAELLDPRDRTATVHDESQCLLQLLILDFAIRNYEDRTGRLPERLDQLAGEELAAVPLDPFYQPFVYRPTDDGFALYSVGLDGVDDGGRPLDRLTRRGDMLLPPPNGDDAAGENQDEVESSPDSQR